MSAISRMKLINNKNAKFLTIFASNNKERMIIDRDYNTTRNSLIIKEYGRNVQELVKYAMSIDDKDKRTKLAHIIISVMQQVNPNSNGNSTSDEYFKKLWNHIYMINCNQCYHLLAMYGLRELAQIP